MIVFNKCLLSLYFAHPIQGAIAILYSLYGTAGSFLFSSDTARHMFCLMLLRNSFWFM